MRVAQNVALTKTAVQVHAEPFENPRLDSIVLARQGFPPFSRQSPTTPPGAARYDHTSFTRDADTIERLRDAERTILLIDHFGDPVRRAFDFLFHPIGLVPRITHKSGEWRASPRHRGGSASRRKPFRGMAIQVFEALLVRRASVYHERNWSTSQ